MSASDHPSASYSSAVSAVLQIGPAIAREAPPSLANSIGVLFIGSLICLHMFGMATVQSHTYYNAYPQDTLFMKSFVALLWVLSALQCAFLCHSSYHYMITNYVNPFALETSVWSLDLSVLTTAAVGCICQAFFIVKVWILGKSFIVTGTCVVLCVVELVFGVVLAYGALHIRQFNMYEARYGWSIRTGLAVAATADVCIAMALVFFLRRHRTHFRHTEQLIQRTLFFTIETCVVTCMVTLASLICFITMPENCEIIDPSMQAVHNFLLPFSHFSGVVFSGCESLYQLGPHILECPSNVTGSFEGPKYDIRNNALRRTAEHKQSFRPQRYHVYKAESTHEAHALSALRSEQTKAPEIQSYDTGAS
ncbi:hypothetical protein PUNSTDRAFT_124456 [Punctularia strigosozonata HHB-11173 SS5]|uniref:uncharacterized protein n=1 Tax=Punctularia strigosozonata (strain HHB-11173) TaxID=741275 RepID=UPI0004416F7D|nr:uncharacterized protein PUNSTDRAFT_124456 [Punctularia strigosozonata HHB-11173 SS5]EIN12749.1 hypothetical protein PUNSTDRAFT_124456 [Punctularia strigosozonata HHB-11173 SS5]